jgi:hypothetical protein
MDATTQITATFLTQHELAELLRLPERTLEDWRLTHTFGTTFRTCSPGCRSTGMGKPQRPAGELGKVDVERLGSGRYLARASTRDDGGAFHRLAATAETEELA